jgi:aspartyl-tRNA synthetase
MKRVLIKDLKNFYDKEVCIKGFVDVIRDQKSVQFIVVKDISGSIQCVIERNDNSKDLNATVSALTLETAVTVKGKAVKNEKVKLGGQELLVSSVKVESLAQTPLPISISDYGTDSGSDVRMDWRYVDLRREERFLIFKVQTLAEQAMREYWVKNGFIEIHSPKLISHASESGAELFELKDYFGQKAYLAQSPQFYKQMGMSSGFDKVFEIGPVFRANPSFTSRHDTEFTSIDMEISWIESHHDLMDVEEEWIRYFMGRLAEVYGEDIKRVYGAEIELPKVNFPRIKLADAMDILEKKMGHKVPKKQRGDLDPEGERLICEYAKKELGSDFVFVTDYPIECRAFYHMRHEDNPNLTKSFDLLWRGLELTTGAQREHNYEKLIAQAKQKGLKQEPLQFYFDFFKYGAPPHGGLGFGLTRMLMKLFGLPNVREVTYLYRGPNRITP